jgi:hypothetical protein
MNRERLEGGNSGHIQGKTEFAGTDKDPFMHLNPSCIRLRDAEEWGGDQA